MRMPDDPTASTTQGAASPRSAERRRLLRGGLAAGPVLMTVASRPVLGQVCTPSASMSIIPATSMNHVETCEAPAGLSPERWKAMAADWPAPYLAVIAQPPIQGPAPTPTDTTCTTTTVETPVSTGGTVARRRTIGETLSSTPTLTTSQPTTTTTTTTCGSAPPTTTTVTSGTSYRDAYRARMYSRTYATAPLGTTQQTTTTSTAPQTYTTTQSSTTTQPAYTTTSRTYGPQPIYTTTATRRGAPVVGGDTGTTTGTVTPAVSSPTPTVGPAGTNPQGTLFHCPTTGLGGQVFGTLTMLQVIDAAGGSYDALGRYIVAALLNAASGRVRVLTETTARAMWNDCVTRGYFEPLAGAQWGPAECVAYIRQTIA